MKSKMFLLGLFLIAFSSVIASENKSNDTAEAAPMTTNLAGVVLDKHTGEPLTGVEVGIEGTSLKAYTDFDGKYFFKSLSPGEYSISASLISYKKNGLQTIKINGSSVQQNLELEVVRR